MALVIKNFFCLFHLETPENIFNEKVSRNSQRKFRLLQHRLRRHFFPVKNLTPPASLCSKEWLFVLSRMTFPEGVYYNTATTSDRNQISSSNIPGKPSNMNINIGELLAKTLSQGMSFLVSQSSFNIHCSSVRARAIHSAIEGSV